MNGFHDIIWGCCDKWQRMDFLVSLVIIVFQMPAIENNLESV